MKTNSINRGRGGTHTRAVALVVLLGSGACAQETPAPEQASRVVGTEGRALTPSPRARVAHTPDRDRVAQVDEAVRRHEASLAVTSAPAPPVVAPAAVTEEGGIPESRTLGEPGLALSQDLIVADVTFRSAGEEDVYPLEPTGRFRVTTKRYRVQLHGAAAKRGLPTPTEDFELFTTRAFEPRVDPEGGAPRVIAVITHRLMRPGMNLLMTVPVSSRDGRLLTPAFGFPTGTPSADVMRDLRARATALPAALDVTGGAR